jgi:hypothetical protein
MISSRKSPARSAAHFADARLVFVRSRNWQRLHGLSREAGSIAGRCTEFGCATYRGACNLADRDDSMIEWGAGARPVRLKGDLTRDEDEQARYISELLDIFETEGIDAAFVYTFARYDLAHRNTAHEDFNMASKGVVKVLEGRHGQRYPDMPWEPKSHSPRSPNTIARSTVNQRLTSSLPPSWSPTRRLSG